jgi:Pvc16 N-terminal domain
MSTALAIAAVTAVLKDLLNNGLIDHDVGASVGEVIVSSLPPDRIDALEVEKKSRLNLFMYQVTPNSGWRNVGLPSRNADGDPLTNPPLALDLHYLLTAYGAGEFHGEILLGYGMQLLHENPVLPREAIRRSLAPPSPVANVGDLPPELQALFASELAEQVEQIKISPASLTTEEVSRMWSAFQAKYRPTAVYQTSVVLIEGRRSTKSALPVRARTLRVIPFKQPLVREVRSRASAADPALPDQPILAGHQLVLVGQQLRGEVTLANVGGIETTLADADVRDTQVAVPIPAALRAGVQGVQVIHRTLLGEPPTPHRGLESNAAAFVLRPHVDTVTVSNLQGAGSGPRSANLHLTVTPAIGDTQRVVLLLNEFIPPASPPQAAAVTAESYSFVVPSRIPVSPPAGPPGESQNLTVAISRVKVGSYLVRLQVDGAESPLVANAAGLYVSPLVTLP